MAPPKKKLVCGFHGPDGPDRVVVSEATLRDAIAAAAEAERSKWFVSGSFRKEDHPTRFGDLVSYWLAGSNGDVRPDRLVSAQKAAIDPKILYSTLVHHDLAAAVARFKVAEGKVNSALADVYRRWDAVDAAAIIAQDAAAKLTSAEAGKTAAQTVASTRKDAVRHVEADVNAKRAPQSALDAAKAQLASAESALTAATTKLETAKRKRKDADQAFQAAERARDAAKAVHEAAVSARKTPEEEASAVTTNNKKAVRKKLVAAASSGSLSGVPDRALETALQKAHEFSADVDAWSAVFVGACVRAAAFALKLEDVKGGVHRGRNGLLVVSNRHAEYIIAARDGKASKRGTYRAFEPAGRIIKKADIIATDRRDAIKTRIDRKSVVSGHKLHCDIVTAIRKVGGKSFAETIGGNVLHTVRRRCYPLNDAGALIVSRTHLYSQENDSGHLGPPTTLSTTPSVLKPASTGRIFAVLSPVEGCDMVEEGESALMPISGTHRAFSEIETRWPWRVSTGEGGFMGKTLEKLESPFLDEEILPAAQHFEVVQADEEKGEDLRGSGLRIRRRLRARGAVRDREPGRRGRVCAARRPEGCRVGSRAPRGERAGRTDGRARGGGPARGRRHRARSCGRD